MLIKLKLYSLKNGSIDSLDSLILSITEQIDVLINALKVIPGE